MAYCKNCGTVLVNGAKFCQKCGTRVDAAAPGGSPRQQEYVGKLYKCPRCGEVLDSFVGNCPTCGLELRGAKATSSVQEFALKLEAIEASRQFEAAPNFITAKLIADKYISNTDQQKVSLIESYAVPNTKEDILEFMILATTSIDESVNGETQPTRGQKAMANAWYSKIKQAYIKARNAYGSDRDFTKIQSMYDECSKNIKKQKKRKIVKWTLFVGWIPLFFLFVIIAIQITDRNADKKDAEERNELNAIVEEIEEQVANGEYRYALMNTDYLVWGDRYDTDEYRYWNITRKHWVDIILEQAANEGIILERPDDPTETPVPTPSHSYEERVAKFKEGVDAVKNAINGNNPAESDNTE